MHVLQVSLAEILRGVDSRKKDDGTLKSHEELSEEMGMQQPRLARHCPC